MPAPAANKVVSLLTTGCAALVYRLIPAAARSWRRLTMTRSWFRSPTLLVAGGLSVLSHLFQRRAGERRRESRTALVGVADMGRGSRGTGLSDSAPIRHRCHWLLRSTAGEHSGSAVGTQRKGPGIGQEFPANQYGGYVPTERLGKVRRTRFPISRRLRRPRIYHGNHQGTHPGSRAIPSWGSSSPGNCSSMPPSMARRTARVSPSKGVPRSVTGGT